MSDEIRRKLKSKLDFDISNSYTRFKAETGANDDTIIYNIFNDVAQLILNYIHKKSVCRDLESDFYAMSKDFYYLNGYDKVSNSSENNTNNDESLIDIGVKSISRGNEKIEFNEPKNITKIAGVNYNTGTINFDEDILLKKYSKRLNKFRQMRW